MAKDTTYTAKDIQDLGDREHVRLRTQVYLGNMHLTDYDIPALGSSIFETKSVEFIPAVYKAVGEIIDNSLDEFSQLSTKTKVLKITCDTDIGKYTISDNGRGIPIEKKKDRQGVDTWIPELVLSRLRSGRNFSNDKEVGVIGQNGVGAACTNYCCTEFEVTVRRNGSKYYQKFIDGANKISRAKITDKEKGSGTEISFCLDPIVFNNVALPNELMRNRAIEIALTNPDVTVEFNGERHRFKTGFKEYISTIVNNTNNASFYEFPFNGNTIDGSFYVVLGINSLLEEKIYTWVNSSLLFDGGKCNTQFLNAFAAKTIEHLTPAAKKQKSEITTSDIKPKLLIIGNIRIKNPEYDSQAKTRLTGPDLRKEIVELIETHWKTFAKKNNEWLDDVLERATKRFHAREDEKAIDEHQRTKRKQIDGLLDATGRNRADCEILITEGESAKSKISEARNPETTAAFALTGKINNVYGATPAQILKMGKIADLLAAIGLTPGKKAMRNDLRYGRIIIATDADYDGSDIFTLLINLFYSCWPELFNNNYEPVIYRLTAPNVVVSKGNKRIHFSNRHEYEKEKTRYKGWNVEYMKGLGSMNEADWDIILSKSTSMLIPIIDDGKIHETLTLLFSDNADARKQWLTTT